MHPLVLEADEMQDYPLAGWVELVETLKRGSKGAQWRCLAEGQLVLTASGWVPIELIKVGDLVWTHEQRWRPVLNVYDNGFRDCVRVSGRGHDGLEITVDHKVLMGEFRRRKHGSKQLVERAFKRIGDVSRDRKQQSAWASPTVITSTEQMPVLMGLDASSVEWLWLYGLYLAEGYGVDFVTERQHHRRSAWCVNDTECDGVQKRLAAFGLKSHLYHQGHSVKVIVSSAPVHEWLTEASGRLAHGKRLAMWVFGLSHEQRQAVFDGMVYGDGYSGRRGRHEYVTVSRGLALGFKLLAQSLGYVCSLSRKPAKDREIDGRLIRSGECFTVYAQLAVEQQRHQSVMADGMVWSPVNPERDFTEIGSRHVYDLEVAEDHSYVTEGIVVSNCHGVSRGVRDKYYELTQEDSDFTVHRWMAMHRPSWTPEERMEKMKTYGGTRANPDYKRNIYGEHGDATNAVFVTHRLMACVDQDEGSVFNSEVYANIHVEYEMVLNGRSVLDFMDLPGLHKVGWSQKVSGERGGLKEVGAVKGYSAFYGGMDVGVTNHPSEILVFGQRVGEDTLDLVARIHLQRINTEDQMAVVEHLFTWYGDKLKAFGIDKTGVGFSIWDILSKRPGYGSRVYGYNFSEKVLVGFEDREMERDEKPEDLAITRNVVEASTDWLRNDYVDIKRMNLPFDRELLTEFQGQTYTIVKDNGSPYGKRDYSRGKFHTLDAAKMAIAAKHIPNLQAMLAVPQAEAVTDIFVGAYY